MTDANPHSDELRTFITYRLSRLQSRLNAQAIKLLRANCELSLTEWRILALAAGRDDITLSTIARETELDKGQLSRAVTALIKKALLSSTVNADDHRQHNLKMTHSGIALHSQILPIMRKRQAGLTANIDAEELETLHTVIDKLESTLDAA